MLEYLFLTVFGIGYLLLAYPFVLASAVMAAWMTSLREAAITVAIGTCFNLIWLSYVVGEIRIRSLGGDLIDAVVPYIGALIVGGGVSTLVRWMTSNGDIDTDGPFDAGHSAHPANPANL